MWGDRRLGGAVQVDERQRAAYRTSNISPDLPRSPPISPHLAAGGLSHVSRTCPRTCPARTGRGGEGQRAAERSGQLGAVREEEGLARARDLAEVREVAGRDKVEEEREDLCGEAWGGRDGGRHGRGMGRPPLERGSREDRRHKVRDRDGLLAHHAVDGVEVEVRS